jgi:glycopeptide antibiotics resistance protein
VSALLCSVAVEAIQLVTALGTCQTGDVVRNVMGAAVAAEVAALLLWVFVPAGGTSQWEPVQVDP